MARRCFHTHYLMICCACGYFQFCSTYPNVCIWGHNKHLGIRHTFHLCVIPEVILTSLRNWKIVTCSLTGCLFPLLKQNIQNPKLKAKRFVFYLFIHSFYLFISWYQELKKSLFWLIFLDISVHCHQGPRQGSIAGGVTEERESLVRKSKQ